MKFKFEIGQRVRETVTGFTGNVTGRAEFKAGQNRYQVDRLSTTGAIISDWLDEGRLEDAAND